MTFKDLRIGQSFNWISPDDLRNSFFSRCTKISPRRYRDDKNRIYRVGSTRAKIYSPEP